MEVRIAVKLYSMEQFHIAQAEVKGRSLYKVADDIQSAIYDGMLNDRLLTFRYAGVDAGYFVVPAKDIAFVQVVEHKDPVVEDAGLQA